jgi:tetratricopeptide (TPR) repeat protein
MSQSVKRAATGVFALIGFVFSLHAEDVKVDLNGYYRSPVSLGAVYRMVTPFSDYRSGFDVSDVSAVARYSLPSLPWLQPTLEVGLLQFVSRSTSTQWEHQDVYGLFGAAYAYRVSKTFELGADVGFGASLSVFPDLLPDTGTVYTPNFLARVGARLALIPLFNFAVEIVPSVSYQLSLGPLSDFDGFSVGIGLMAHARFGEDPDTPKAVLRSLRISQLGSVSVFPAMQSWYARNPFATVSIENTASFPARNIEITFYQKGYMDSPTLCARLEGLAPGEKREVGLLASFNEEVFRNEGTTPLSGEIVVTYTGQGRAGEQRASLSYDLQDKSGIIWDDDRKAAAFITPSDSALRNYASNIRQIHKESIQPGYSDTVQFACQLFNALGEIGILYQVDPLQPFASVKGASLTVDSVSLPRQTLTRTTGDCDDLSVLYASILESAGVQTALITVPGHICVAFGTNTAGKDYGDLSPDRNMTINLDNELWVPVEITMIGRASFAEAWKKGVEEWRACEGDPSQRGFYLTGKAQEIYRPVGLKETDLGLQYGRKETVVANSVRDVDTLVNAIVDSAAATAKASGSKQDRNRLGIRYARFGRYDKALAAFKDAAAMDPGYVGPRMNTGNVYLLMKSYDKALAEYQRIDKTLSAAGASPTLASLRLNMSQCYGAMGREAEASRYLALAVEMNPSLAPKGASPEQRAGSTARAAEAATSTADPVFEE